MNPSAMICIVREKLLGGLHENHFTDRAHTFARYGYTIITRRLPSLPDTDAIQHALDKRNLDAESITDALAYLTELDAAAANANLYRMPGLYGYATADRDD